ncbi:MAG: DUF3303 family protein [Nitrospinota bacterium]
MALFGIYGSHATEMCPINNLEIAKTILEQFDRGIEEQARRFKINTILGQFHSALEHTFLWIVDADDPHLIQQFCIDVQLASFNAIKIVPLITVNEVAERLRALHGL